MPSPRPSARSVRMLMRLEASTAERPGRLSAADRLARFLSRNGSPNLRVAREPGASAPRVGGPVPAQKRPIEALEVRFHEHPLIWL
jgi:hypothetical protein